MKTHQGQFEQDNDWQACPSGTMASLSSRQKAAAKASQRVRLARNGAVLGLVLAAAFVGWQQLSGSGHEQLGSLACREVLTEMDSFFAGELDPVYRVRVLDHLRNCAHCRRKYEETATNLGVDVARADSSYGNVLLRNATQTPMLSSIVPLLR